jgi:predicted RNA-binding Zn-ribbon protein involved in translation (DUF1610 family)
MTEMLCRACGERFVLRSRFEAECTECGSEDIEELDAYVPEIEHLLRCEFCGYRVDTTIRGEENWAESDVEMPTSVDDPCPICGHDLVPDRESKGPKEIPEYKLARAAAEKLRKQRGIVGPPYDTRELAKNMGLNVVSGAFNHDGMLEGTRIEVPDGTPPPVERFLIAHEIGHYELRHEGERQKVEPEANAFASELVVPRDEPPSNGLCPDGRPPDREGRPLAPERSSRCSVVSG